MKNNNDNTLEVLFVALKRVSYNEQTALQALQKISEMVKSPNDTRADILAEVKKALLKAKGLAE